MKKLKTWEMLKELQRNTNKKFKTCGGEDKIAYVRENGDVFLGLLHMDAEWEEIKEPVSFMEAVQSGKEIKPVNWDGTMDLPSLLYSLSDYDDEDIQELLLGKWHIED